MLMAVDPSMNFGLASWLSATSGDGTAFGRERARRWPVLRDFCGADVGIERALVRKRQGLKRRYGAERGRKNRS